MQLCRVSTNQVTYLDAAIGEALLEDGNLHDPWLLKRCHHCWPCPEEKFTCMHVLCEVTGSRQYSADLAQGGLEILSKLIFKV